MSPNCCDTVEPAIELVTGFSVSSELWNSDKYSFNKNDCVV